MGRRGNLCKSLIIKVRKGMWLISPAVVNTGSYETQLSSNQAYPHMHQPFVKELLGIVSVGLMILTVSQIVQVH